MGNTVTTRAARNTNFPAWEYALLSKLGAPATPENLVGLNLWARSEGVQATANNPLAITNPGQQFGPDAGTINDAGVAKFGSLSDGADATAKFLSAPSYASIVAALKDGTSLNRLYSAINSSAWCRGCQGGKYPVALSAHTTTKNLGTIPIFHGGQPSGAAAVVGGKSSSSSGFTQCNSATEIVGGLGFNILNACQAKALVGGLLVATGLITMVMGGAILMRRDLASVLRSATPLSKVPLIAPREPLGAVTSSESPRAREDRVWREMRDEGRISQAEYEQGIGR